VGRKRQATDRHPKALLEVTLEAAQTRAAAEDEHRARACAVLDGEGREALVDLGGEGIERASQHVRQAAEARRWRLAGAVRARDPWRAWLSRPFVEGSPYARAMGP